MTMVVDSIVTFIIRNSFSALLYFETMFVFHVGMFVSYVGMFLLYIGSFSHPKSDGTCDGEQAGQYFEQSHWWGGSKQTKVGVVNFYVLVKT